MVQVVHMGAKPSLSAALGAGFEEGFTGGLNQQLQDMQEQKRLDRQMAHYGKINKQIDQMFGDKTDQEIGMEPQLYLQAKLMNREQQGLQNYLKSLYGEDEGVVDRGIGGQQFQPTRQLQPGEAPMLPYEDMPAEEQEEPIPRTRLKAPIQKPIETAPTGQNLRQQINAIKERHKQALRKTPPTSLKQAKEMRAQRDKEIQQARETYQAEAAGEKNIIAREKSEEQKRQRIEDINRQEISPTMNEINERETMNSNLMNQLRTAKAAVQTGNTAGLIPFIASRGYPTFDNPDSALLNYLSKENIANIVDRIGGRNNMFLDKVARTASATPGHDKPTALSLIEFEESEMRQDKKRAEIAHELAKKYSNKKKMIIPGSFKGAIEKRLQEWIPKNVDYTAYRIQKIKEQDLSDEEMDEQALDRALAPGVTPITKKRLDALTRKYNGNVNKAAQKALELGYIVTKQRVEP